MMKRNLKKLPTLCHSRCFPSGKKGGNASGSHSRPVPRRRRGSFSTPPGPGDGNRPGDRSARDGPKARNKPECKDMSMDLFHLIL